MSPLELIRTGILERNMFLVEKGYTALTGEKLLVPAPLGASAPSKGKLPTKTKKVAAGVKKAPSAAKPKSSSQVKTAKAVSSPSTAQDEPEDEFDALLMKDSIAFNRIIAPKQYRQEFRMLKEKCAVCAANFESDPNIVVRDKDSVIRCKRCYTLDFRK